MSACECDCDFDDGRYFKTSRYCPDHDMCEYCGERLGVMKDPTFDAAVEKRPSWYCEPCAKEASDAEMLRLQMEVVN